MLKGRSRTVNTSESVFSIRKSHWEYRFSHWALVLILTALYFLSFKWSYIYAALMIPLFAYSISTPTILLLSFIYYLRTRPLILKAREELLQGTLPENIKVAFFRPVFAKTTGEMDTLLSSMKKDILNNQDLGRNLKYIVIDNTRDEAVKTYTQDAIRRLQSEFGEDVVFYFHRNVKCDFFKKLGIYMDTLLLMYEGKSRPSVYTQTKWDAWTKGTRNPNEPLFDVILGNVQALGLQGTREDILAGRDVVVHPGNRVEIAFVSDADNVWPKGEVRKLIAKILHPENRHISIYQPTIRVSNPSENPFIKWTVLNREFVIRLQALIRWRLFHFSPFYGKGAMKLDNYIREIIQSEKLHPGRAASHDFQESLWTLSVLLEDVYIDEKTFSNKISELKRDAQWRWGDLETVRQYFWKPFEIGRKTHLYVLLRGILGDLVLALWLLGMIVGFLLPPLMKWQSSLLFYFTFSSILILLYGIPRFIFQFTDERLERKHSSLPSVFGDRGPFKMILDGLFETGITVFVHSLDLLYKPRACIQNLINQVKGKPFVWKTGAMAEIETAQMNFLQIYRSLYLAPIVGAVFAIGIFSGLFPSGLTLILFPFMISFLIGPFLIWLTRK